jgi:septum formation protein
LIALYALLGDLWDYVRIAKRRSEPENMENELTVHLVLASNSPRRKELLKLGGWSFRIQAADVDESVPPGEKPQAYVLRLAQEKAFVAARGAHPPEIVLAADTAVVDGGQILGKPRHAEEAARMLRLLRGHTHQVFTGLAVLRVQDGRLVTEICVTDVPMRVYTEAEIASYVASGDPVDKAGAYAIQNRDFHPVLALSGCYASVMGLPLCHLSRALSKMGLETPVDIAFACQSALDYACDFYPQVIAPLPE